MKMIAVRAGCVGLHIPQSADNSEIANLVDAAFI
jgi:hypothetical protein